MSDPKTTSPRAAFRAGYLQAQADAVDRCRIEMPATGCNPVMAIQRCIDAISALDVRHALNNRLADLVKEQSP